MTHEPACFMSEPLTIDRPALCICDRLRAAYERGLATARTTLADIDVLRDRP